MKLTDAENRELAGYFGIEPQHSSGRCLHCGVYCTGQSIFCTPPIPCYPDFSDPRVVLREMDKRPDGKLFYAKLMYSGDNVEAIDDDGYISRYYITDTTGLLAKAALEWLRKDAQIGEEK